MKIIKTIWYLCGLMIVAVLALSAMSVVPEGESERKVACIVGLFLAGSLACAGIWLGTRFRRNPSDPFLMSTRWTRIILAVAIILTFVVLFGVIG